MPTTITEAIETSSSRATLNKAGEGKWIAAIFQRGRWVYGHPTSRDLARREHRNNRVLAALIELGWTDEEREGWLLNHGEDPGIHATLVRAANARKGANPPSSEAEHG